MITLSLLALACTSPQDGAQPHASPGGDAAASGSAAPTSSAAEPAAAQAPSGWAIAPSLVRWDPAQHVVTIEAAAVPPPEDDGLPRWVGVTLLTASGEPVDLAVHTLLPGARTAPILFTAQVDAPAESVVMGLWGRQIQPCGVDRPGCRDFGFVLDDPLASWPPGFYTHFVPQRMASGRLGLLVRLAGGDPAAADAAAAALSAAVAPLDVALQRGAALAEAAAATAVSHKHPADAHLARVLSAALGADVPVRHAPDAADDLVVTLGGEAAAWTCARAACADLAGDALLACASDACPR